MTIEIQTLGNLLEDRRESLIFEAVSGSVAYGTNHAKSDIDIRGIYVLPQQSYLGLAAPKQQVSDEKGDIVYYTLQRFIELAATANPNIIEMFYMPADCVRYCSPVMKRLIESREMFISRKAYKTHVGYAQAQIKKARGRNKWVNNPQPEEPPVKEDFCWFVPQSNDSGMPFRPMPLQESDVDLNRCHCSSLEHAADIYRLYDYGDDAHGVFRNGMLVCESIAYDDEARCIGLLIYNRTAYDRAKADHKNYWRWREERNDQRWLSQESGEMDYDAKNMMHTFRLLLSGENILRYGRPIVRFEGEQQAFLKKILAGKFEYEQLMEQVESKVEELGQLHAGCDLPDQADANAITQLLRELTQEWESENV